MSNLSKLTLSMLTTAVAGEAVAIRAITKLAPAGGPTDKVFPPTYVKEGRSETKYAMEIRKVDGHDVQTVLLDSVASQANRLEEALLEGWRRGESNSRCAGGWTDPPSLPCGPSPGRNPLPPGQGQ